jgi:AraC-like DNA-binding protein
LLRELTSMKIILLNKSKLYLFDFIQTKINLWTIVSANVIILIFSIYLLIIPDQTIFPSKGENNFQFYTDSINGGNSEIVSKEIKNNEIFLEYKLKRDFQSPYVGIKVTNNQKNFIKVAKHNQLSIDIEGNGVKNIILFIYTNNPSPKDSLKDKELCFYEIIDISSERKQYKIDLETLKVPDWWRDINNYLPNEKIEPDLNEINSINIGTAYSQNIEAKSTIQIYSLAFTRANKQSYYDIVFMEIGLIIILLSIHAIRKYFKDKTKKVSIVYEPVNVDNETQQINKYLDYINRNFQNPDLTITLVSKQTGINQKRIANSIQKSFDCNYKTYVNQIRITEAKRLLKETELNIGEIAFKVGFNNQSHFNRLFKSQVGLNPSEFREFKK